MRPLLQVCTGAGLISLDVNTYSRVASENKQILEGVATPEATYRTHFKIAGAKVILDGSPQIRTAWMTEPYFQPPEEGTEGYCGQSTFNDSHDIVVLFKECMEKRWQLQMQCNGDAAIDQCLDAYEQALQETGLTEDLRPVLIHCQTIREDQLDRLQKTGHYAKLFSTIMFIIGAIGIATLSLVQNGPVGLVHWHRPPNGHALYHAPRLSGRATKCNADAGYRRKPSYQNRQTAGN